MSVIKSFNLTGKGDETLNKAIDGNRDSNLALERLFIPYGVIQGDSPWRIQIFVPVCGAGAFHYR